LLQKNLCCNLPAPSDLMKATAMSIHNPTFSFSSSAVPCIGQKPLVICSDFDGTITERDAIVMTLERFAPPEWKAITRRILKERTLNVREGLPQLYALMGSHLKEDIHAYLQEHVQLREGFSDFMAWCHQHHVPFHVVSGGLDAFIHPLLHTWKGQYTLYSNVARFDGPAIGVEAPYAPEGDSCKVCGQCGCCKVKILEQWPGEAYTRVVIGDSVTDFGMAQVADVVFARHLLAEELDTLGVPYIPYETFHEIQEALHMKLDNPCNV
jgi:2-hydroxy-3-keto-5-methylthiopentenyl-1-phosphate phosphatase